MKLTKEQKQQFDWDGYLFSEPVQARRSQGVDGRRSTPSVGVQFFPRRLQAGD
jgi:hypothetical protein